MLHQIGKRYRVVEVFRSIQGEGSWAGALVVFVRFQGCNSIGSCMGGWCDTDYTHIRADNNGGEYGADDLCRKVHEIWGHAGHATVVTTGGEPLLQLDRELLTRMRDYGFRVHVETNGSIPIPTDSHGLPPHWVTVSPKPPTKLVVQPYDEVKVVYPAFNPLEFTTTAPIRYVQPLEEDGDYAEALVQCREFVERNPEWRVGLQLHKLLGVE